MTNSMAGHGGGGRHGSWPGAAAPHPVALPIRRGGPVARWARPRPGYGPRPAGDVRVVTRRPAPRWAGHGGAFPTPGRHGPARVADRTGGSASGGLLPRRALLLHLVLVARHQRRVDVLEH